MDNLSFVATFINVKGEAFASRTVSAFDWWDACRVVWSNMPEGAEDFDLTER